MMAPASPSNVYFFHGLRIASPIELDALLPLPAGSEPLADVVVKLGPAPAEIAGKSRSIEDFQVGTDEILLTAPTIGRFLARAGTSMTIDPAPGVDRGALQLYMLGPSLAAILHQRGEFPLHACAFEHRGECIALLGDSGAGKSTIAAMLANRGYRLLSDDVLVTRTASNARVMAMPSQPLLKLWPESLAAAGLASTPTEFECIDHHKHRIPAGSWFGCEPLPLARLYALRWLLPKSAAPELKPLDGLDALLALRANVYRPALIEAMGREAAFMNMAARLLPGVRMFEFCRPMDLSRAEAQLDVLLSHLRHH